MDSKDVVQKLKGLEGRRIKKVVHDEKSGSISFVLDREERVTFSVMYKAPYTPSDVFINVETSIFLSAQNAS